MKGVKAIINKEVEDLPRKPSGLIIQFSPSGEDLVIPTIHEKELAANGIDRALLDDLTKELKKSKYYKQERSKLALESKYSAISSPQLIIPHLAHYF